MDNSIESNVKYNKVEFIDSTEKIVIDVVEPMKRVIILPNIKTQEYFSIRSAYANNDINITITYTPESDFYDKKQGIISEHNYYYTINYGAEKYTSRNFSYDEALY
jgi:hypothetical protein